MKLPVPLLAALLVPLLALPAHAETQTVPTDKGTLDVRITHEPIEPGTQERITIDFVNASTQNVQEHIDYTVEVTKDGEGVFGPIPRTHTSVGTVNIPIEFGLGDGVYKMDFVIDGILFQPIPQETASFDILVGTAMAQPEQPMPEAGGGCLIATAAFGTETAPQVQQLRELRDNTVMQTASGAAFMSAFNGVYYTFSPAVADLERQSPAFKELVRAGLAPMLASLSLLNGAGIDTEAEMLGYGIPIILLNLGMYAGLPALGVLKLYQSRGGKLGA